MTPLPGIPGPAHLSSRREARGGAAQRRGTAAASSSSSPKRRASPSTARRCRGPGHGPTERHDRQETPILRAEITVQHRDRAGPDPPARLCPVPFTWPCAPAAARPRIAAAGTAAGTGGHVTGCRRRRAPPGGAPPPAPRRPIGSARPAGATPITLGETRPLPCPASPLRPRPTFAGRRRTGAPSQWRVPKYTARADVRSGGLAGQWRLPGPAGRRGERAKGRRRAGQCAVGQGGAPS